MENVQSKGPVTNNSDHRLPLEPAINIINENDRHIINSSSIYNTDTEEVNNISTGDSENEKKEFFEHLSESRTAWIISSAIANRKTRHGISIDTENKHQVMGNDTGTDFDNKIKIYSNSRTKSELESSKISFITEDHSIESKIKQSQKKNEAANMFFNELYDKKLNLYNKFTEKEIKDIHEAVKEQIKRLAVKIGKKDSRLKIQEVVLVGSAREGTQIIRPCEYDFILVLELLSKQEAVSLTPINLFNNDNQYQKNQYMHVKLQDPDVRSVFSKLSDKDGYLRCSHWIRCFGLRGIMSTAIYKALRSCSKTAVKNNSGTLTFRCWKPKCRGPAFTVRLVWERNLTGKKKTMEISIDLCPAMKVDALYHDIMPAYPTTGFLEPNTDFGSVLLMPRDGMRFQVAFTEAELSSTLKLSDHHKRCYKILKYIINGEPFPPENLTNRISEQFQDSKTSFHSYELKLFVWQHQHVAHCREDSDLCKCISTILQGKFEEHYSTKRILSFFSEMSLPESLAKLLDVFQCDERVLKVQDAVSCMLGKTETEYNYKDFEKLVALSRFWRNLRKALGIMLILMYIAGVVFVYASALRNFNSIDEDQKPFAVASAVIGPILYCLWVSLWRRQIRYTTNPIFAVIYSTGNWVGLTLLLFVAKPVVFLTYFGFSQCFIVNVHPELILHLRFPREWAYFIWLLCTIVNISMGLILFQSK